MSKMLQCPQTGVWFEVETPEELALYFEMLADQVLSQSAGESGSVNQPWSAVAFAVKEAVK